MKPRVSVSKGWVQKIPVTTNNIFQPLYLISRFLTRAVPIDKYLQL